jgi:hypothetical protein
MFKVRVTVEVVTEHGDVVNGRGYPAMSRADGVTCTREFEQQFEKISEGRDALNKVWAFLTPIDTLLAR